MKATCAIEDCDRDAKSRGWCKAHYHRWQRYGDPGQSAIQHRRLKPEPCKVESCDRVGRSFGWCPTHYTRWFKYGDPLYIAPRYTTHGMAKTHGMTKTPAFRLWADMNNRCYNPNNTSYADYGGRGIRVCDEWRNDFVAWYEDIGKYRPVFRCHLDRIDNNGNYEPGNVRWVDWSTSMLNRRNSIYLTIRGETKSLVEGCNHPDCQTSPHVARARIRKLGYTPEDAIFTPRYARNPKH